jgi:hypothetical protein
MDVRSTHTVQAEGDNLWQIKQDAFFRISDQVGNIHKDDKIPAMMRNISLYLEADPKNSFVETKFRGIYRETRHKIVIN